MNSLFPNILPLGFEYHQQFLGDEAGILFDELLKEINWQQSQVIVFGKEYLEPRLSYWMGDEGLQYSYSGKTMKASHWYPSLLTVKQKIEQISQAKFNSVLLNYYRDGKDSNGWHSDNEPELGVNPVIASVTLGGQRDFQLRNKQDRTKRFTLELEHDSLLVMNERSQTEWQHQIPKRAYAEPRINLTFRQIK